jgi:DNA-binding MarR family transcriptional regulator
MRFCGPDEGENMSEAMRSGRVLSDGDASATAPSSLPLWSRPGFLVRRLHQIHSALFLEECAEFAITPVQYGLLTALLHFPGADQVTLGAEVGLDRTNVADVLERLGERGLIRREQSRRDRRSKVAYLTPRGEALTKRMHGSMQRAQERLLQPLAPEFRPAFMAMLLQLIEGNNRYSRTELRADLRTPPQRAHKQPPRGRSR